MCRFFTDWAKDPSQICRQTSNDIGVYPDELYPIFMALCIGRKQMLVCSDIVSALHSLRSGISSDCQDLLLKKKEMM